MFKAYKFRLYPDKEQQILLEKHFGSCRFVWNYFLDLRNTQYVETGKGMSYKSMQSLLPSLKKENEWLKDINAQSLQVVLQNLDTAFSRFFRNIAGYPTFKKKKTGGSFTVPQHFTVNDRRYDQEPERNSP